MKVLSPFLEWFFYAAKNSSCAGSCAHHTPWIECVAAFCSGESTQTEWVGTAEGTYHQLRRPTRELGLLDEKTSSPPHPSQFHLTTPPQPVLVPFTTKRNPTPAQDDDRVYPLHCCCCCLPSKNGRASPCGVVSWPFFVRLLHKTKRV